MEFLIECMDDLSVEQQKVKSAFWLWRHVCVVASFHWLTYGFFLSSNITIGTYQDSKRSSKLGYRKEGKLQTHLMIGTIVFNLFIRVLHHTASVLPPIYILEATYGEYHLQRSNIWALCHNDGDIQVQQICIDLWGCLFLIIQENLESVLHIG